MYLSMHAYTMYRHCYLLMYACIYYVCIIIIVMYISSFSLELQPNAGLRLHNGPPPNLRSEATCYVLMCAINTI